MDLVDLPPGLVRVAHGASAVYLPTPPRSHRPQRPLRRAAILAAAALAIFAGGIGAAGDGQTRSHVMHEPNPPAAAEPQRKDDERLSRAAVPAPEPRPELAAERPVSDGWNTASRQTGGSASGLVSAYAPAEPLPDAPFELLIGEAEARAAKTGEREHWWSDRPLPASATTARAITCLAEAVYFEARGESVRGQAAVAQVILNRVKNPAFPDRICDVVYQNRAWYQSCQFTFACDSIEDSIDNEAAWKEAQRIAIAYASGALWLEDIGAATHYHALSVSPRWAGLMNQVAVIDNHAFYMTLGGGLS